MLCVVFFRAKDLGVLGKMYDKVANDFSIDYLVPFFHARPAWTLCIIGVMLSYLFTERQYHRLQARFILLPWVAKLLLFIICLQMVVEFLRRVYSRSFIISSSLDG